MSPAAALQPSSQQVVQLTEPPLIDVFTARRYGDVAAPASERVLKASLCRCQGVKASIGGRRGARGLGWEARGGSSETLRANLLQASYCLCFPRHPKPAPRVCACVCATSF